MAAFSDSTRTVGMETWAADERHSVPTPWASLPIIRPHREEWNRRGSRAGHPLAARLVEQNGGGNGGVQRFHAHGGDGDMGRRRAPLRADAMGFAADN